MARPRRQEARRAEIVSATTVAIAERGLAGLRIKDIAEAASLSQGSVAYYYPDIDDLLLAVHEAAVDRFYRARRDALVGVDDPIARLDALIGLGVCDPTDPMWTALYELHLHSARIPRHATQMSRLFALESSLYREVIDDGIAREVFRPRFDVDDIAATAVSLEDGFGVHLVARNDQMTPQRARTALRGYLAAVLDCSTLRADRLGGSSGDMR